MVIMDDIIWLGRIVEKLARCSLVSNLRLGNQGEPG